MYFPANLSFSVMGRRFSRRKKMKVFIADDSRIVVERLADLLEEEVPGAQLVDRQATCRKRYGASRK